MDTHSSASGNTDSSKAAADRGTFAFLESETALQQFVEAWKAGRLPKPAWTHAAHVTMAAYFAFDHAADATFAIMKAGILHHNTSVGTPNTEDNGYHETLTRFWASEIGRFVRRGRFTSRLEAVRAAVAAFGGDRERFRRFYSFDVVRDRRARREWVAPDREPLTE
jgi:hypothetical protein